MSNQSIESSLVDAYLVSDPELIASPPTQIDDHELLHRRIYPTFIKPDGSISSQAFKDNNASVDRGHYRSVADTLSECPTYGVGSIAAGVARNIDEVNPQEVVDDRTMLNPAHALIRGNKTKSVTKKLAKESKWVRHPIITVSPNGSGSHSEQSP